MAQQIIGADGARRLTVAQTETVVDHAVYKGNSKLILGLIREAKNFNLGNKEMTERAYRVLRGHIKQDFSSETYPYVGNSYKVLKNLIPASVFEDRQMKGIKGVTVAKLDGYLKEMKEFTKGREKEGEISSGKASGTSEDFVARLSMASMSGVLTVDEVSGYLQKAIDLSKDWISRGKLDDFDSLAMRLNKENLMPKQAFSLEFGAEVMQRLRKSGSDRLYRMDKKSNDIGKEAKKREINTFIMGRNLTGMLAITAIDIAQAKEIIAQYKEKGIIIEIRAGDLLEKPKGITIRKSDSPIVRAVEHILKDER